MAFCSKCGAQLDEGSQFCESCGAPAGAPTQPPVQPNQAATLQQPVQSPAPKPSPRKYRVAVWLIPLFLLLFFACCCCSSFGLLSLVGAQGQPATVISPSPASESKAGISGSTVPIPKGLSADSSNSEIALKWNAVSKSSLKSYGVYKSLAPGKDFSLIGKVDAGKTTYSDAKAKKGVVYYYVVTAVTADEAESGNSKQASAMVEAPPLVPKGIYSWADVKKKCEADSKYLKLLRKVTGLTKSDVDRLARKEKDGMKLKKTLSKGTIVTNSTKNYKILYNYKLKKSRLVLTDENGTPHVLVKCGNPMKIQISVTTTTVIIQQVQVFVTNIIMIFPPSIINIFINAAQPVNDIVIVIMPDFINVLVGITVAPPSPDVYIDPVDFGPDSLYQEEDLVIESHEHEDGEDEGEQEEEEEEQEEGQDEEDDLPEGQQWIEEGKVLVIADPHDPDPGQSVNMTVRLTPVKADVEINYEVQGTDDYSASGTKTTDANGEITFSIPGGTTGVRDIIKVTIPSLELEGSAEYQF